MRRRDILRGAAGLGCGTALAIGIDAVAVTPNRLAVSRHFFGPAQAGRRVRIAHISDLHIQAFAGIHRQLLEAVVASAPDLLVITGDSIDAPQGLAPLEQFLASCPPVPRRLAILGNWEYKAGVDQAAFRHLHEEYSFALLVNESVSLEFAVGDARQPTTLRVTGLDDLQCGRADAAGALAGRSPCDHHLILAHCPAQRDDLGLPADHPADLVLSGHTHGGQVTAAGMALVTPPGSGRYVAGWYRDAGRPPLFVSRGVGMSTFPVRLGATPELAIIDWMLG